MRVVHFQRKPDYGHFSLESCFKTIRQAMDKIDGLDVVLRVCPHLSQGLLPRLKNMIFAAKHQETVNHITGDIHFIALSLKWSKTLLSIHDCETVRRRQGLKRWLIWLIWYQLPCLCCKKITTISGFTRDDLLSLVKVNPDKVEVVYDLISTAFVPKPKAFNRQCPVVLHVGTAHNKNIPMLAQALKGVSCRLRIIGKLNAEQISILDACAIDYSSVHSISEEAVVREYEDADMLAFASTYEGFGMPILEAQAVGRPVLTSQLCSMPEIGGDAACYVDPYDVDSIRAGLLKIIQEEDYRDELIRRGYENVKRFSPERIAQRYYELYKSIA